MLVHRSIHKEASQNGMGSMVVVTTASLVPSTKDMRGASLSSLSSVCLCLSVMSRISSFVMLSF